MSDHTGTAQTGKLRTGQATGVGKVESQLNDLWSQAVGGDEAVLKATTLNLLIDSDQPDRALADVDQIARRHPCRALIFAMRDQADQALTATPALLLMPTLGREARQQVIAEAITLTAGPNSAERLASSAQSLIVADQPTFLWQVRSTLAPFTLADPIVSFLSGSLDGLVIDSTALASSTASLRNLAALVSGEVASFRGCVHDLAWLRLGNWRLALSHLFEPTDSRPALFTATELTITYSGSLAAPWLLIGWLADRLDWQLTVNPIATDSATVAYTAQATNRAINIHLQAIAGQGSTLHQVSFKAGDQQFSVTAEDNCFTLHADKQPPRVVPGGIEDVTALVGLALDSDGCDPLYAGALQHLIPLIGETQILRAHAGIVIAEDSASLSELAARTIAEAAAESIAWRGRFTLALSGGTTPRVIYERLATEPYRSALDWSKIHLFWGDERNVPIGHPDSNQGMTKIALIDRVPIPPENVHWIQAGAEDAAAVASTHAADLRTFFTLKDADLPHFDLILLGMGEDGHTASLFPHTAALTAAGTDLFIANVVPQLNTTRLTLTADVINAAQQVIFLVGGAKKADILHDVLRGPFLPDDHPSQRIQPTDGQLTFLIDRAAAGKL